MLRRTVLLMSENDTKVSSTANTNRMMLTRLRLAFTLSIRSSIYDKSLTLASLRNSLAIHFSESRLA